MPTPLPRLEKTLPLLIVAKRLGFRSEFLRQLTLSRKKKWSNPAFPAEGATMKNFPSPVLPLFAIAIAVIAVQESLARADLEFPSTTVEVGEIRAGSPLSYTFNFQNRGADAV